MKKLSIALLALIAVTACDSSPKTSPEEQAKLRQNYDSLYEAVNQNWKVMMDDDDEKLFYMKRLLDEISYTNDFDSVLVDSLRSGISTLKSSRYDSMSMADSEVIDQYDAATAGLSQAITSLAQNHPEYSRYPLMEELIFDIMEANDRILLHRIRYDQAARGYNTFVEGNKDVFDPTVSSKRPEKYPVFSLSGE